MSVLEEMILEDPYNLTIRPSDLCEKADKSRMTFSRHYMEVGDILKQKDRELLLGFSRIELDGLSLYDAWQRVLVYIFRNRELFKIDFSIYRFSVIRDMLKILMLKIDEDPIGNDLNREIIIEGISFDVYFILKNWIKMDDVLGSVRVTARVLEETCCISGKTWREKLEILGIRGGL